MDNSSEAQGEQESYHLTSSCIKGCLDSGTPNDLLTHQPLPTSRSSPEISSSSPPSLSRSLNLHSLYLRMASNPLLFASHNIITTPAANLKISGSRSSPPQDLPEIRFLQRVECSTTTADIKQPLFEAKIHIDDCFIE